MCLQCSQPEFTKLLQKCNAISATDTIRLEQNPLIRQMVPGVAGAGPIEQAGFAIQCFADHVPSK